MNTNIEKFACFSPVGILALVLANSKLSTKKRKFFFAKLSLRYLYSSVVFLSIEWSNYKEEEVKNQ